MFPCCAPGIFFSNFKDKTRIFYGVEVDDQGIFYFANEGKPFVANGFGVCGCGVWSVFDRDAVTIVNGGPGQVAAAHWTVQRAPGQLPRTILLRA
jgi:hypothetical protein